MRNKKKVISATLSPLHSLILVVGLSTLAYAGKDQFVSFDFPGSTNTQATAITPSGELVGRYISSDGIQHGFVLSNGAFTSLDVPGASFTDAAWINARGVERRIESWFRLLSPWRLDALVGVSLARPKWVRFSW